MRSNYAARFARLALTVVLAISAAACATTDGPATPSISDPYDPIEGTNRKLFAVNQAIDGVVIEPAAKTYRAVTTKRVRRGAANFLDNMRSPVILVNDLLQGEFKRAGVTFSRFALNTTIGFYGTFDPAERLGLPYHSEDFGQTLAVWGVPSGPYLVIPPFGPTTLRDGAARFVDAAFDPFNYLNDPAGDYIRYTRTGGTALSAREAVIEPLAELEAGSLDYYVALRSVFLQARRREILNGRETFQDLPEFDEFDEFDVDF